MGKTIIMIHGMWGSGSYWENYAKYFEERGYRCIRPTLRFHDMNPQSWLGKSPGSAHTGFSRWHYSTETVGH
jgi:esterase/lipase